MTPHPQLPSDAQLTVAARDGMNEAWGELVRRHGSAVGGVAKALHGRRSRRLVQRALDKLHGSIIADDAVADDVPAIRAVRPRAIAELTGGAYGPGSDVIPGTDFADIVAQATELESIARAFEALPESWQTALWHRSVEQSPAAEFAPLLGRTANEAAAVVERAEAGLFEGFLLDQVSSASNPGAIVGPACVPIVSLLGGSMRSTLSAHQQRVVDDHLQNRPGAGPAQPAGCRACQRRIAVRDELSALIPPAIVPNLTKLTVHQYRAAVGVRAQPAGAAEASELRHERVRKVAALGAVAAVLLAVVAAIALVRNPFEELATPASIPTSSVATTVADTATDLAQPTGSTTSSTLLDLRPGVDGPVNEVRLEFAAGLRAVGFASPPPALGVLLSSPGPIFAGGTGTIDVTLTNSSADVVDANFSVRVPVGVVLDELVSGAGECFDPDDDSAFCNVSLASDSSTTLALRFTLTNAIVGRFMVESSTGSDPLIVPISAVGQLVHSSIGNGDIKMIGNTVMSCVESAEHCLDARDGVGEVLNRWDIPAAFVGAISDLGWTNSSSATLELGESEGIEAAYLFWSGDLSQRNVTIADDGSRERISVLGPGQSLPFDIEAEQVRLGDVDATQYLGAADVTDLVQLAGAGDYLVGNIQSVEVQGSYAGWALVVVTKDATQPRRELVITSPFAWFSPDDAFALTMAVPEGEGQTATLDLLAFEGERQFVPEQLVIGGVDVGDDGSFDSTIVGPRTPFFDNNFGIDIDTYALSIDAPNGILPVKATSGKDGIRLAVFGFAVDLE